MERGFRLPHPGLPLLKPPLSRCSKMLGSCERCFNFPFREGELGIRYSRFSRRSFSLSKIVASVWGGWKSSSNPPLRSWTVRPSIWSSSLQQVKRSHHWRDNRRWLVGLGHKRWEMCVEMTYKTKRIQMRHLFPKTCFSNVQEESDGLSRIEVRLFPTATTNKNTTAEGSPGSLSSTSEGTVNSPQQVIYEWKSLQFTTEHLRCFGKLLI